MQKVVRLVIDATNSKAPIAKVADKVAGVFVHTVITIAIITTIIWLFTGGFAICLTHLVFGLLLLQNRK